jgi:predicted amidohydrolase YtcJ
MVRAIVVLLAVAAAVACTPAPRIDRLLVGGIVHTPAGPANVAIAISEGRIVALPAVADVAPWRRAAAEVVELAGAHVYPGFKDGHGHLTGYGTALEQVDLSGAASFDEVVGRTRLGAAALPPGSWVQGRGWDQNLWPDKAFPTHAALSAAIPDHPVALRRVDGHALLLNAAALATAGIGPGTADPPGGRILRDPAGVPTGVLVDSAVNLVDAVLPHPTVADIERRIRCAATHLGALGLTGIHDAGTTRDELAVLRTLQHDGALGVRVYVMLDGSDAELLGNELPSGPWVSSDGMLAVRAVKLYADGALGSRGAWLSAPYSDEPATRGLEVTTAEKLEKVVRQAAGAGFQPCIHAIGDAAVTRVLDIYEHALGPGGAGLRPRLEHAQVVTGTDVPRFASLGVVAAVQPTHCTSDMMWAPARLGAARMPWAYRWRSLLAAGVPLCLGSDVPVEDPDPRRGIFAAVTRRAPGMTPAQSMTPAETLTVNESVAGFTSGVAFASFSESWCGAIALGYAADLTIFDRDLATVVEPELLRVKVVRTVVHGRDIFVAGS